MKPRTNYTKTESTTKSSKIINEAVIFRRSLIYQTKEFFQNSTLHGVRYIAETGRPAGEKFMWFCFTVIGTIAALVIIMSLWEKFQTNPTITGLDTDFHNQQVIFPTTVVCPEIAYDEAKAVEKAYKIFYDKDVGEKAEPFVKRLTGLSFDNLEEARKLGLELPEDIHNMNLRRIAFDIHIKCEDIIDSCKYRDEEITCCSHFDPVYTEHGFCFAFNSRFKSKADDDEITGVQPHDLYETDKKWALQFVPNRTSKIYLFSYEEQFGGDFKAQLEWVEGQESDILISKKNTYTTDDARQLSIQQRKCIFYNEYKLHYYPGDYTFSSCMKECRMRKTINLCKCVPPFFKPVPGHNMCKISDFDCLIKFRSNITNLRDCRHCELSCSKTVYNIEKLNKNYDKFEDQHVQVEFLTWPIIRYKREVLFGWVDLLVSFGGIAGLFLGFSLLSGVEIIYYFTLRACCMVYRNKPILVEIEEDIKKNPPKPVDLYMLPRKRRSIRDIQQPPPEKVISVETKNNKSSDKDQLMTVKKPRNLKDFSGYARGFYSDGLIKDAERKYGGYIP